MGKNIFISRGYPTVNLKITYDSEKDKFILLKDENSDGRKYNERGAYHLAVNTILMAQKGEYRGTVILESDAREKLRDYEIRNKIFRLKEIEEAEMENLEGITPDAKSALGLESVV